MRRIIYVTARSLKTIGDLKNESDKYKSNSKCKEE